MFIFNSILKPPDDMRFFYLLLTFTTIALYSCETQLQKEERLSKQYCAGCHVFPDPGLLDKTTWEKSVLPEMAFRMGLNTEHLRNLPAEDIPIVLAIIPPTPMVSEQEWKSITAYFIRNAPDSIKKIEINVTGLIDQFSVKTVDHFKKGFITALAFDSARNKIYVGNRWAKLYTLDAEFKILDSVQLKSPPSHISPADSSTLFISLMGIMDPNDQSKGELISLEPNLKNLTVIHDSLQRPVYFDRSDLNNDGRIDYLVCAFGNFRGALLAFEKTSEGKYKRHIINPMPGARKVISRDFNHDGLMDILALMTQGDESLILYTNRGNFSFDAKVLIRFPPVYGSNYFEIADFNKDGFIDILLTNGDNADYSAILKPYHAIRIFTNDGLDNFAESWSFAMPGSSQAAARDFDNDGDLDIAAISFFPDFEKHPEQGFIYFKNNGGNTFTPQVTPLAASGRWLVMEDADIDHDGDLDILLGAANFIGLGANSPIKNEQVMLFFQNNLEGHK
jgi:hypothetical protein